MDIRQRIAEASKVGPVSKKAHKVSGAKNPNKVQAGKANWKSNRTALVAGIKKFWASAEGKALRAKISKYRAAKEGQELDLDGVLVSYFEAESPELLEALQEMLAEEAADVTIEASEILLEEDENGEVNDDNVSEAVIKARRKHRVDPERSRLMKMVRARNKASFARGAKAAAKTKKSNGTYKALGKFNATHDSIQLLAKASAFLEGKEVPVNEGLENEIEERIHQLIEAILEENSIA